MNIKDFLIFKPKLKTSIGEIISLFYDGNRYYIDYIGIDNKPQSWDLYGRSDEFLDVVSTALEETYPEIAEADSSRGYHHQ